jgi:hypothetical protein
MRWAHSQTADRDSTSAPILDMTADTIFMSSMIDRSGRERVRIGAMMGNAESKFFQLWVDFEFPPGY